ncbi:ABC transporter ATP-binding protein [Goodfellowiella coeruleoviolacea]|uniref:ABC-2 type transport system ATP-binding protein n=1 Tax=Goodfellowiella coeruleoviolacea TaxID=334858 RepID=A0AAE3GD34_9PSEU|nr:ABC transporter ATP-binding protein [Goodfellowiella coeruleoviolacea]MCP2165195.1 ABC-2 type transport system ATP-binding protein [Goodfellowiella coeruleoviolacea]
MTGQIRTRSGPAQHGTAPAEAAEDRGAAVRLTGLRKRYGQLAAVDGVELTIAPGEVVALLGPNGAGKSTTVDMLLGLTTPDAGRIRIFGQTPSAAVGSGTVGAMLQNGALLADVTVGEIVGLVAALHRTPLPVAEALRRAGIADLAGRRCGTLSGGQQQRVRFAVALVCDPDLLVLDEPTVAMDVTSRRQFWQAMRAYTDTGRTVLFATHYLEEAEEYADRVVLMRAGRVVADGSVAQVRAAVAGRTLRAVLPGGARPDRLLALPGVNRVDVRAETATLACTDSDAALRALLAAFPLAHDIEITAVGLEDAFHALTGRPDQTDQAGPTDQTGEDQPR